MNNEYFGAILRKNMSTELDKSLTKRKLLKLSIFILLNILSLFVFVQNGLIFMKASMSDSTLIYESHLETFYEIRDERNSAGDKKTFISTFNSLISEHYHLNKNSLNELSYEDRSELLRIIYEYAKLPNSLVDEFTPLAFIMVETQFYPFRNGGKEYVVGWAAGEKSLFQFTEQTAKSVYSKMGKPWNPEWYKSLEESVWVWFYGYHFNFAPHFKNCEDYEELLSWTAYAYNAGPYKNNLKWYFETGKTLNAHFDNTKYTLGDPLKYTNLILENYTKFKQVAGGAYVSNSET